THFLLPVSSVFSSCIRLCYFVFYRFCSFFFFFFFFNDTATTEIYTLSLHDALPISGFVVAVLKAASAASREVAVLLVLSAGISRSEEHTSELQSLAYLVCRLLLEKKKKKNNHNIYKNKTDTNILLSITTYIDKSTMY